MRTPPDASSLGFSLIEVLMATTVLALALATLAHLFVSTTGINDRSRGATTATLLAVEKMEQLRTEPMPAASVIGEDAPLNATYLRRWTIDPLPAHPTDTVVVQVVVTRVGGIGDVCMTTVRTRKAD
jgi:prepilin-type N-terminal cleavage/methylation domain-containing protein